MCLAQLFAEGLAVDTEVSRRKRYLTVEQLRFVASRRLPLHPSVYYANSLTTQAIQVADLVAGITRRVVEDDTRFYTVGQDLASVHTLAGGTGATTHTGRNYTNWISLF